MNSKQVRHTLYLMLAAFIWGAAFVFQSTGADEIGPYSFNSIRFIIGGIFLLPIIKILDVVSGNNRAPKDKNERRTLIRGGVYSGIFLFLASTIQQLGIYYGHSTAKAGFLTACYILIVPILGIFLHRHCGLNIWIGVVIALVGLYFICGVGKGEGIEGADGLLISCAFLFSLQILVLDRFSPLVDPVRLSCIEFFVSGIIGLIPMTFEIMNTNGGFIQWILQFNSADAWIALLYCGILSSGVAYTLQTVGIDGLNPTVASLLMSLESVFAALAGALLLKEKLTSDEFWGCVLIFGAIILAQLNFKKLKEE